MALQGVKEIQLIESAVTSPVASRVILKSLNICIAVYESLFPDDERLGARWRAKNANGLSKAFPQRPIPKIVASYCAADIQFFPELREIFWTSQNTLWRDIVKEESKKRVTMCQRLDYQRSAYQLDPQNPCLAPWSELQNTLLNYWEFAL